MVYCVFFRFQADEDIAEIAAQKIGQDLADGLANAIDKDEELAEAADAIIAEEKSSSQAVFSNFTITSVLTVLAVLLIKL